ncbi:LOW QUALITY PROTEIN: interleukin-32 [Capricornis sumatraensis]|uniref:LOW QUALITY PROTEIN: interleukin-32 n=1 Tax=Capricornis sumatraensis TaxID=34865 RepID=UPI00360485EF
MCFAKGVPRNLASLRIILVRSSSPRIAGAREVRILLGDAENDLAHLGPSREKNRASFTQVLLCSQHTRVENFCDKMGNEPEEAQMEAALAETEEELSKDVCEFIEDHIQENLPESLQECSPLLQQARQEVRCRIQRRSVSTSLEIQNPEEPSVSTSLEVQNLEESIWVRALRRFQGILRSLQQRCWDVLTWLGEMAAACLQAISSAVNAILGVLTDFCFSVGQLFRIFIQV